MYLTSHRLIYIDNREAQARSVALPLAAVESVELYAGFMRSSPKITMRMKARHRTSGGGGKVSQDGVRVGGGVYGNSKQGDTNDMIMSNKLMVTEVTWICPICYFSNTLPQGFQTSGRGRMPSCVTCGIKATPELIAESIKSAVSVPSVPTVQEPITAGLTALSTNPTSSSPASEFSELASDGVACPRCTFVNHPSMNFCEICGARIVSPNLPPQLNTILRQSLDRASLSSTHSTSNNTAASNTTLSTTNSGSSFSSMSSVASSLDQSNFVPEIDDEGYLVSLLPRPLNLTATYGSRGQVSYKLSFRSGGERPVYEQFKQALEKKVWEQRILDDDDDDDDDNGNNKSAAKNGRESLKNPSSSSSNNGRVIPIGIHGLQLVGEQKRAQNQEVLGEALEDLSTLMARAKEVVKLAQDYAKYLDKQVVVNSDGGGDSVATEAAEARRALQYSTQALGLQMSSSSSNSNSNLVTKEKMASLDDESLFHSELARQIADFLSDNPVTGDPGVLSNEGGVITLFDLFAVYNRARGGVDLISPRDLYEACRMLTNLNLNLPIMLRTFSSGLMVLQESYRTADVVVRNILELVNKKEHQEKGISAIDVSNKFKWSVMIANEELEMAELRGVICRDDQLSGTTFYANEIPAAPWDWKAQVFGE